MGEKFADIKKPSKRRALSYQSALEK